MKTKLVFEDDHVLVVDKPAGLLTMATDRERSRTVYAELRSYANQKRPPERVFIVHRLDREASGLLVFAKTAEAKQYLQDQFKNHSAGRYYIAVAQGNVTPDSFVIRSWLAENAVYRVYSVKKPAAGKLAITHVRVLKRKPKATILEIRLETGRKHQIRVHLAERGHPIVGDTNYGSRSNPLRRLALHGAHLEFRHPVTRVTMQFDSPYPGTFDTL
jgi:23S rRNA pseudouridine1911/1915/1917 synthase